MYSRALFTASSLYFPILPAISDVTSRALRSPPDAFRAARKTHRFKSKEGTTMRPSITLVFAAAALGTALASAPAFAQPTKQKVLHQPASASPSSLSPSAPVSPGGIGASPNSYGGGPGFSGEVHGTATSSATYSGTAVKGAPVSPGGIGASPNSFNGGPGYSGDVNGSANSTGKPTVYSSSSGGISASPNSVSPGYQQ
jgi:hypothetical protein